MKAILLSFFLCFAAGTFAQSSTTYVVFNRKEEKALMLSLPYNEKVAEGTIISKLKETGYDAETKGKLFWKQNKTSDFYVFRGVNLNGTNGQLVDLYFKVDGGVRNKEESKMFLLVGKGNDVFITEDSDPGIYSAAKRFLNSFTTETANYKHTLDVQAQEETIKKAEKKLIGLQDDEKDLNKKLQRLQEDLKKNKEEQELQQKTLENEKKKLEELKATKA